MAYAHSKVAPILPQEIVDLVVDEIARQNPDSESLATLLACRLVCKSFAASSRQHIFSNLILCVDDAYMKRISRLIDVLEERNNSHLVGSIRSLKITIRLPHDQPDFLSWQHSRLPWPRLKDNIAKAFGRRRQHAPKANIGARVLELIERADIHNFTLQFKGKNLQWPRHRGDEMEKKGELWHVFSTLDSAMSHIFGKTNLTTLSFINISGAPSSIISRALQAPHIEEIIFRNFQWYSTPLPMTKLTAPMPKLKKLEIRKTGVLFLQVIITDPFNLFELRSNLTSATPTLPNVVFTHLRTLVATIPGDPIRFEDTIQLELFCTFLLGVSPTLEVLELETLKLNFNARRWFGQRPCYVPLIHLDRLVALRSLKLSAKSFTGPQINIDWSLQIFSILLSPIVPTSIKSIDLELVIPAMRSAADMSPINPIQTDYWRDPSHWSEVDDKLVGPYFPDLQSVHLSARVSPSELSAKMDVKEDSGPYAASILPNVAASPVIEYTLDVHCLVPLIYNYDYEHEFFFKDYADH